MKVNEYRVLLEAVENGLEYGFNRYLKYLETDVLINEQEHIPYSLKDAMIEAIMLEICEYFHFDDFYADSE